jgi:molecular chaperone GrpE (heat shock protein)
MDQFKKDLKKRIKGDAIEDLMLAKMALEEKSEIIEQKDQRIVELLESIRNLESEYNRMKIELSEVKKHKDFTVSRTFNHGVTAVIEEIMRILTNYERCAKNESYAGRKCTEANLVENILHTFSDKYGLEILDDVQEEIDPNVHQVINVDDSQEGQSRVVQLSKGYKLFGRLIEPTQLIVLNGNKKENEKSNKDCASLKKQKILKIIKDETAVSSGPGEVA